MSMISVVSDHGDVLGDHDDVIDNQCHDDSPVMALLDERTEETGQSLVGDRPPLPVRILHCTEYTRFTLYCILYSVYSTEYTRFTLY